MLFFLWLPVIALPIKKQDAQNPNLINLPHDIMHTVMNHLNFKDSLALSLAQKWNQENNPLRRQYLNPLSHHCGKDDQALNLLLKFDTPAEKLVKLLTQNPSLNQFKLLEFMIKKNIHQSFILQFEKNLDLVMFLAAKLGKLDLLQYLMESSQVDPASRENLAFLLACQEGHLDIVNYLLDYIDPDQLSLLLAAGRGHVEVVKKLLENESIDPTFGHYAAAIEAFRNGYENILDLILVDERTNPEELSLAMISTYRMINRCSELLMFVLFLAIGNIISRAVL